MNDLKLSITSRSYVIQELDTLDLHNKAYRLKVSDWGAKRTLTANGQIHVFIGQIAKFTSTDALTAKCEVKIDFGLPLIMMRDDEYSRVVDYILTNANFYNMEREDQIVFITAISVTSMLTTKESKTLMDDLIYFYNNVGLELKYKDK